jgi:hypothetical protein
MLDPEHICPIGPTVRNPTPENRAQNACLLLDEIQKCLDEPLGAWGLRGALTQVKLRCSLLRATIDVDLQGGVLDIELLATSLYSRKKGVEAVRDSLRGQIREKCRSLQTLCAATAFPVRR